MKKWLLISFLLLFIPFFSFSQDLSKEEIVISENDTHYGIIVKQILWYNPENILVKAENILTDQYSEETGIAKQVDYYRNDLPYLMEMYFNETLKKNTGVLIRKEYVDEKDEIQTIEFIFVNNSSWKIEKNNFGLIESFPIRNIEYFIDIFMEDHSEDEPSSTYNLEAPVFTGMSLLSINKKLKKINSDSLNVLKYWIEMHSLNDTTKYFTHELLLSINGKPCLLLIQESLLDIENEKEALVYYYYLGGTKDIPVFAVIGYFD